MTENQINDHDRQASNISENSRLDENTPADQDIIELSDIAIGITPEDDAIVEMTEEIIGEAFFGFNTATSDKMNADESELDLSEKRQHDDGLTGQPDDGPRQPPVLSSPVYKTEPLAAATHHPDDDISRQLDNYFGVEEAAPFKKQKQDALLISEALDSEDPPATAPAPSAMRPVSEIPITAGQFDEALERVIRKLYAEKINRILDVMIERTVTEEISQLKDYLIGIAGKKN